METTEAFATAECIRCGVYIQEYYSAMRKKDILPFGTTWMDLEDIRLNESDRERQYHASLICGTIIKSQTCAKSE